MKSAEKIWGIGGTVLVLAFQSLGATEPVHAVFDSYEELARGTTRSVSLSDDGRLGPAPAVRRLADVDVGQIWAALPEPGGGCIVATSPDGKLFRISNGGEATLLTKFEETHLYALARNDQGEIFVGTSPGGKIYKLDLKNKPVVYFDPHQKYIWSLAFDRKGNLFVATGSEGKIFKISGEGQGTVYYDSDETHIRSLAFDNDGNLLAGSAENGLLYRITGPNQAVVLASSGKQEVNRIAVTEDGAIYFSATGGNTSGAAKSAPATSPNPALAGLRALILAANGAEEGSKTTAVLSTLNGARNPATDSTSVIFRLDGSMYPQPVWTSRETILSLETSGDSVLVGTGDEGYIYRVGPRGENRKVVQVEASSITSLQRLEGEKYLLTTSNPSRVFVLGGQRAEPGIYESPVIDSGSFARWGALQLKATGTVEIKTRSGNTPKPDKSWYPWSSLTDSHSPSPEARYFQFELLLTSGEVDRVEVVYLSKNLRPKVELIKVLDPNIGYVSIVSPPQPPQPMMAEQLLSPGVGPEAGTIPARFLVRFQPTYQHGLRTVVWRASDPNDDDLQYVVSYRPENSTVWRVLARDLKESVWSWDTSGWPDGNYYLKVDASDVLDNALGEALTDTLVSRVFTVDNTPPKIVVQPIREGRVTFTVSEALSNLKSVTISTDGKDFKPVPPVDGILDSRVEQFSVPVEKDGVLLIRAEDTSGNVGSAQAQP